MTTEGFLVITCQRLGCGQTRRVKTRYEQQRRKYCSRECAEACWSLSREAMSRGGKVSARRRRAWMLDAVKDLTPLAAFKAGYVRGLASKTRQAKARQP